MIPPTGGSALSGPRKRELLADWPEASCPTKARIPKNETENCVFAFTFWNAWLHLDSSRGAQLHCSPMSAADRPLGRGACIIALLALLAFFSVPLVAFRLATRGEIVWPRGEASDRLFVINEPEVQGLGLESVRAFVRGDSPSCARTRVRFFLWKGEGQSVEYCDCGTSASSCP